MMQTKDHYVITEKELQRIVARAVKVALSEILGAEQLVEAPNEKKLKVKQFSDKELEEAMQFMAANRNKHND